MLNEHVEKLGTQQKVLEFALESLEKSSKNPGLTEEDKLWISVRRTNHIVLVERAAFKLLIETADNERMTELFIHDKSLEFAIEFFFEKPFEECSLKEIMDGLVMNFKLTNWFDTVGYTDDGDHYTMKVTHSMGVNLSKLVVISIENALKTYGVKAKSIVSTKSIFIKMFKNK